MFYDFLLHLPKWVVEIRSFEFGFDIAKKQTCFPKSSSKIKLKIGKKLFLVMASELMIFAETENENIFHFRFWCTVRNGHRKNRILLTKKRSAVM
jgi:hypothetical protein